jgi:hypothetical protein
MPIVQNIQVVDTTIEQYGNVSFHAGTIDIVPHFHVITENVAYGTITKVNIKQFCAC